MSQADFKKRLKALMLRPENQVCSDCPERQPRWASLIVPPPGAPPGTLHMGAFCCLECSGSHRRLGVHISFVRSVNLDQWKEKEVLAMENGGNQKVNAIFEAHLNVPKPTNSASGPVRERFIRDKYERRKFYDPNAFARVSQMESQREEEEVVSGVQRRLATSRAPSDAARKRVEERATRNNGTTTTTRVIKAQTVPASSPPPPAPVVVDLLDFGDFDSPEAASAVQASVVTSTTIGVASSTAPVPSTVPTPLANKEPAELDLFASMSIGNNNGASYGGGQMAVTSQPVQPPPIAEPKKMTTDDILSMFNAPSGQQSSMQPNMMFPGAGMNGITGGNNMGMMNTNMNHLQQPMNMMNNMNHQQSVGMMNSSNMNPQQQMAMMNNMQMMQMQQMMGHQGMNNMGGNNMNMGMMGGQGVGMMQQGQIPQMNNMMMMMMQGGGGGIMHGGNQFVQPSQMMGQAIQQQQQSQSTPQMQQRGGAHLNQFADLGSFAR